MSGVAIIRARMLAASGLLALVPATSIRAGDVPIKSTLPWISLEQTGLVERENVAADSIGMQMERVRATVYATTYPAARAIAQQIEVACKSTRGSVAGFTVDSILPEQTDPDEILQPIKSHMEILNYFVRYYE